LQSVLAMADPTRFWKAKVVGDAVIRWDHSKDTVHVLERLGRGPRLRSGMSSYTRIFAQLIISAPTGYVLTVGLSVL
jgi:hypothetical protein